MPHLLQRPTLLCLMLLITACDSAVNETTQHEPDFEQLFAQAIHCAAVIAITEQQQQGELSPKSQAFRWVGFTLGQANNYKVDGKLSANTEEQYRQQSLALFLQPASNLAEQYPDCVEQAKLYDPTTQMQAVLKKARNLANENKAASEE